MIAQARALLRANVDTLGLGGETRIFRRDARKLGAAPPGEQFSLAFLDPPYGKASRVNRRWMALRDGKWLTPDALASLRKASSSKSKFQMAIGCSKRAAMAARKFSLRGR